MCVAGNDIHHNILQFLEEGAIDLVCIATDLEMARCDTMRDKWEVEDGTKCDCWVEAYQDLFGSDTIADADLATCTDPDGEEPATAGGSGSGGPGPNGKGPGRGRIGK